MAAKKKSKKPAVKKLNRDQELRQQLFVALAPACVTMNWTSEQVIGRADQLAVDYLMSEKNNGR